MIRYIKLMSTINKRKEFLLMNINQKLITPITETKYLTAENADRYHSIIQCLYLNYEKLKY